MLGYLGYYGVTSSVAVPNIVGLSTSAASSALSAVGLVLGSSTGSTTSGATSGNNGYIATQSKAEGELVDPGTVITYTTYSYVAPCVPTGWYNIGSCNGCTIPQADGCGGTRTADCSYLINLGPVTEYLIGQDATHCYYQTEYKWQDSCTGAYSYTTSYWSTTRSSGDSCYI